MSTKKDYLRRYDNRAAVFVDYDNVFSKLASNNENNIGLNAAISETLAKLRKYLLKEHRTQITLLHVYADFEEIEGQKAKLQHALCLQGAEARYVSSRLQRNAAEIQLCVDAVEALHTRPEIDTIVFVTGDRNYIPLIQHVIRAGKTVFIASLDNQKRSKEWSFVDSSSFLDLSKFLDIDAQAPVQDQDTSKPKAADPDDPEKTQDEQEQPIARPVRTEKVDYKQITEHAAYRTLELIEEHFGQYAEIYLTPLLRKLSEEMNDPEYDPKTVVNELEEAGAVWLEKRNGNPYDYTVLMIDGKHPDAQQIQEMFSERNRLRETYGDISLEDLDADESFVEEGHFSQPVNGKEKEKVE